MLVKGLNHLAFITPDMEATIRFYRDLLEMDLISGIGHEGFRHYFFKCGDGAVAFFEYEIAQRMSYGKFHGAPTDERVSPTGSETDGETFSAGLTRQPLQSLADGATF